MDSDDSSRPDRQFLTLAQMAARLGVSPRTAVRYRSEYAPYLNPFAPAGGGRGLRLEALEVLKVIHELKSRRAHWAEIKAELDSRFGVAEAGAGTGSKSFLRSLEAIRQSHQLMTAELRLLFGDVNRRLDTLEENVKLLQSLLPLPQRLAEERTRREVVVSRARQVIEEQQRQIQKLKGEIPRTGSLFNHDIDLPPQPDSTEES